MNKNEKIKELKRRINYLKTFSPFFVFAGFTVLSPQLISTDKEYNYTIETNYDDDKTYDSKLIKDEVKLDTITIYDEYKKQNDMYMSNYKIYDASNLTKEKIKEISTKNDLSVSEILGEPIYEGTNFKKEKNEEDNNKNIVATLYSKSDKYYISRRPKGEIDAQLLSLVFADIVLFFGALAASVQLEINYNKKELENEYEYTYKKN